MELKIEDLKAGDGLVCIDREYFTKKLDGHYFANANNVLKVTFISNAAVWVGDYCIPEFELQYFKKKEDKTSHNFGNVMCDKNDVKYTFDDLIDVVVQANKDRVINGFSVVGGVLNCQTLDGEDYNLGIGCEVAHGIEYLQSLYKETFVIKNEDDVKKIKDDCDRITLSNGELMPKKVFRQLVHDYTYHIAFKVLKGATVEQQK